VSDGGQARYSRLYCIVLYNTIRTRYNTHTHTPHTIRQDMVVPWVSLSGGGELA